MNKNIKKKVINKTYKIVKFSKIIYEYKFIGLTSFTYGLHKSENLNLMSNLNRLKYTRSIKFLILNKIFFFKILDYFKIKLDNFSKKLFKNTKYIYCFKNLSDIFYLMKQNYLINFIKLNNQLISKEFLNNLNYFNFNKLLNIVYNIESNSLKLILNKICQHLTN